MLILYFTEHCHLCEDAKKILDTLGFTYETIDIADDDDLLERYGVRIPVLTKGVKEIGWPFTVDDVRGLMQSECSSN